MTAETCGGCGHAIRPPYKPVWTWEDITDGMISTSGAVVMDTRRAHIPWHRDCLKAAS